MTTKQNTQTGTNHDDGQRPVIVPCRWDHPGCERVPCGICQASAHASRTRARAAAGCTPRYTGPVRTDHAAAVDAVDGEGLPGAAATTTAGGDLVVGVRTERHGYQVAAPARGLLVRVYRAAGVDATAGGVSAVAQDLVVVGVLAPGPDSAPGAQPVRVEPLTGRVHGAGIVHTDRVVFPVAVQVRRLFRQGPTLSLGPVTYDTRQGGYVRAHSWTMHGGNYAAGDSRFSELAGTLTGRGPFYGAVAIHDRVESP